MRLLTAAASGLFGLVAALPKQQTASPSIVPEPISTPTPTSSLVHLEVRQGVAVTAAPLATVAGQVSPITTVQIGMVKNGAYVQIEQIYTQTFVTPVDQWPAATAGSIGLGTIRGAIGVVKTKRDAMPVATQLPSSPRDTLTLESLRKAMDELPIEDASSLEGRDLVLTTAELDKLMASLPVEDAVSGRKRNILLTPEMLDKMKEALTGNNSK